MSQMWPAPVRRMTTQRRVRARGLHLDVDVGPLPSAGERFTGHYVFGIGLSESMPSQHTAANR